MSHRGIWGKTGSGRGTGRSKGIKAVSVESIQGTLRKPEWFKQSKSGRERCDGRKGRYNGATLASGLSREMGKVGREAQVVKNSAGGEKWSPSGNI